MRALFGGERYTAELAWADLAAVLPGWEIIACPPEQVSKHLDGVDVICPVGARIHTREEIPFYTGRRKPVSELLAALP